MAVSIMQLQALRDAIVLAIGNPTLRARTADGKEVQYRSIGEAKTALGIIDDEIRKAGGASTPSVSLAQHKRGDGPSGPGAPWGPGWSPGDI
jgi:hypothetical protein